MPLPRKKKKSVRIGKKKKNRKKENVIEKEA